MDEEHLKFYSKIERYFQEHSFPGKYLVDHFPILLKLPRSLQWFRKAAEEQGSKEELFYESCMDRTKDIIDKGSSLLGAGPRGMEKQQRYQWHDKDLAILAGAPYAAGVGTTVGTIQAFLLACISYPRVMKKAQDEVDSVVGIHRMPEFEDLDYLPYVQAIIKECLRWHPFPSLGIPHSVVEDDAYDGMFIPAGSTVVANIYGMTRDPELFPDPETFRPERFLDTANPLLQNYNLTFGFGRRVCPGQRLATDQLFAVISRLLWAFNIVSVDGRPNHAKCDEDGKFGPPALLPYKLVPRGEHVASIIIEQAQLADKEAKDWESVRFD
ncbi:hypothetical protein AGABI2DRAFT_133623 [Agaricus bisporus var. bisporus H97]|uniref:hypothetical protein n=1 Tax=Agaricus bisporus var. bisporus (strain H97 / ATCC MYA-4626 / FGSC 10389) TaxID=936046 RepID=UPI00029F6E54|nr:hypothetical protein AGABI2DRAFT_133623 [Agaricus bisporus var. bisporus H97]EKV49710.1 hypothetical protein AGABI2DRAFT_133623 [Agaricus bisporus var. bisporus H97]